MVVIAVRRSLSLTTVILAALVLCSAGGTYARFASRQTVPGNAALGLEKVKIDARVITDTVKPLQLVVAEENGADPPYEGGAESDVVFRFTNGELYTDGSSQRIPVLFKADLKISLLSVDNTDLLDVLLEAGVIEISYLFDNGTEADWDSFGSHPPDYDGFADHSAVWLFAEQTDTLIPDPDGAVPYGTELYCILAPGAYADLTVRVKVSADPDESQDLRETIVSEMAFLPAAVEGSDCIQIPCNVYAVADARACAYNAGAVEAIFGYDSQRFHETFSVLCTEGS